MHNLTTTLVDVATAASKIHVDPSQIDDAGPIIMASDIHPGGNGTAPLRITLSMSHHNNEFVTHQQNMQDGGRFGGHYFRSGPGETHALVLAMKDFVERTNKLLHS